MSNEETKEALKEALKEWLDHKFTVFGKWSAAALCSAVFGALVYFWLQFAK